MFNFHRFCLEVLIDFKLTPWIDNMFELMVATSEASMTAYTNCFDSVRVTAVTSAPFSPHAGICRLP